MKLPRHAEIWFPPYLSDRTRNLLSVRTPLRHAWVTIADHFEPYWNRADFETARRRVRAWRKRWPDIAAAVGEDSQSLPKYTFFYPVEQYHPEILDRMAEMMHAGIADVEVHIHHDGEGREEFVRRMSGFCCALVEHHGLLRTRNSQARFGFIHGNWALDNSLPRGLACGLNDEISLLRDLGCYADFTMPSGPSPSQARMINTIYWCNDDPRSPKSYDRGTPVRFPSGRGRPASGDLLMIPGPLGLRWKELPWNKRRWPRMETGELAAYDPPTAYRARRWFDLAPRIGEHLFLKLYTHGAQDSNLEFLLDGGLRELFRVTAAEAARNGAVIHYVSAWEMFCAIDAISAGADPCSAVCGNTNSLAQPEAVAAS